MKKWQFKGYTLRDIADNDFEDYYNALTNMDDETRRYTGSKRSYSKDQVQDYFNMISKQENRVDFLIVNPQGKIIGESVLNDFNLAEKSANFRIALFNLSNSNRGIGTWVIETTLAYGFDSLDLHKIELDVFSFNERAFHVYQKVGFEVDDVIKESIKDGDNCADDIIMSMSKDTWCSR